jgi:hypothetical protein
MNRIYSLIGGIVLVVTLSVFYFTRKDQSVVDITVLTTGEKASIRVPVGYDTGSSIQVTVTPEVAYSPGFITFKGKDTTISYRSTGDLSIRKKTIYKAVITNVYSY